jgi:hypothetical protein
MSEASQTITFRVDEQLKRAFVARVRERDRDISQVFRDFMRSFVQEPSDTPTYDEWFRAQVHAAQDDTRRPISSTTVEQRFASLRKAARKGASRKRGARGP